MGGRPCGGYPPLQNLRAQKLQEPVGFRSVRPGLLTAPRGRSARAAEPCTAAQGLGQRLRLVAVVAEALRVLWCVGASLSERHTVVTLSGERHSTEPLALNAQWVRGEQLGAQLLQLAPGDALGCIDSLRPDLGGMTLASARAISHQLAAARMATWFGCSVGHGRGLRSHHQARRLDPVRVSRISAPRGTKKKPRKACRPCGVDRHERVGVTRML